MFTRLRVVFTLAAMAVCLPAALLSAADAPAAPPVVRAGERIDPPGPGCGYIEHMDDVIRRDMQRRAMEAKDTPGEKHGIWVIPTRRSSRYPHSGLRYVTNKWGDTHMGIAFGRVVDVHGAYIAGQGGSGVWTKGLVAIGYRDGMEVARTDVFTDIDDRPDWFAMELAGVDRVVLVAEAALNGAGWYAMDDLAYTPRSGDDAARGRRVVVDFEEARFRQELTGSDYAGLRWETGTGDFTADDAVEQPLVPDDLEREVRAGAPGGEVMAAGGDGGTLPALASAFQGVLRGDAGSFSFPPDTNGAIGPNHYVITVNRNFAIYDRDGNELVNVLLGSFLPGSNGDPRVIYDQYADRWVVLVTDFSATETMFLAVSRTSDPTGAWYKDTFFTAQGPDAGCWPDYPTLGYDADGYYIASWMVGCDMTIWMLEKAPLIDETPSLGVITAFRGLRFEGSIHPTSTFGDSGGEYFVSRRSSTELRIRQRVGDITSPSLAERGNVSIPAHMEPPDVPALGSNSPLDHTTSHRIMNAVYRNGSIWTCHDIGTGGRSACRWYEIDPDTLTTNQTGTVSDPSLHYFYCSIAVNDRNDVALGFSGSNEDQYAGCYYTGRLASDPPGEMAPPAQYKEGTGPQNNIDSVGRNRWGDYSFTSVDPVDDRTFWTLQEYGHDDNIWGTYAAVLAPGSGPCVEDLDGSGNVDIGDLLMILTAWGNAGGPEDLDGSGTVDIGDLVLILTAWGPC